MQDKEKNSRQELSEHLQGLHNQHGFNVRFNDGGGDAGGSADGGGDANAGDNAGGDAGGTSDNVGAFVIPDKYKDKPYLEGVDSMDALLTKFDGAETLLGKKRTVIPDETFSPEMKVEFFESIGVPKDSNDYEPVSTEEGADNTFFDAMKPILKKAGVTKDGAKVLAADMLPVIEKITGKKLSDDKANDAEFDTMTTQVFGATKDQDLAQAKALLVAHTPECFKGHMETVDNKTLTIVASALKNVRAKYMAEDGSATGGGSAGNTGADELRTQAKAQIAIAQDPKSTIEQKETATKKARELYKQWGGMQT